MWRHFHGNYWHKRRKENNNARLNKHMLTNTADLMRAPKIEAATISMTGSGIDITLSLEVSWV